MNIFILDKDPKLSAQYHCDKHVVKMILESTQMMCTIINTMHGKQVTPYKTTHAGHPCTVWAAKNYSNFHYLWTLTMYLNEEYKFRYEKAQDHKSWDMFEREGFIFTAARGFVKNSTFDKKLTRPPLAMPDDCKLSGVVDSYRNYYNTHKRHIHSWTNRETPCWVTDVE